MRKLLILIVLVMLCAGSALCAEGETPWWKREKIRFMWGCWAPTGHEVPREVIQGAARSGGTVFAELWAYIPADARAAKEFGMQYFAGTQARFPLWDKQGRAWVKENGETEGKNKRLGDYLIKCPLDEGVFRRWLVTPYLAGAEEGIVDGIHVDWEAPGYTTEPCYCDDCFSKFLTGKGIKEALPEPAKRYDFLKERGLVGTYEDVFHRRRVEMFTKLHRELQAVNPDLLFSSYDIGVTDFTRAMNTPETPFIVLDARHYYNDDRQPWWESYSERIRKEGYLYIAGGWVNALFGSQPSEVSASQWIYESAINEDGCWLWFEHEVTDEMLRGYSTGDRRIRAVQDRVGKYLFNGERDLTFVSAREWTGRPGLDRAIKHQTYHLGREHLAHINNVNAEWALRVRIRFPRLGEGRWTVRDAMSEQYYTRDGKSAVWTTAELREGVVVAMATRSDVFLLVSPAEGEVSVDQEHLMDSRDYEMLPGREEATAKAGAIEGKGFSFPKDGWYLRMDAKDAGIKEKWYLPTASLSGWKPIEIENFWGGKGGVGAGWYRRDVEIPGLPEGNRVYLHFGAVDEELMLWIDGVFVGEHNEGPSAWDKPFSMDVTGKLSPGKHHFAMRVYNSAAAGGIWKEISMVGEGASGAGTEGGAGRLAYTATQKTPPEQQAFPGGCGVGAIIDNAIFTIGEDGTNRVRVRQLHGRLWSPRYSPDGKRLAFVYDQGGRGQVYVMNADGTDPVNISENAFCDRGPVWSPTGEEIAFVSDREGDWDIFVMQADGSDQRRVAGNEGMDRAPAWSPDGKRIAWESHVTGIPGIWVCDSDGGNSRPLIGADRAVAVKKASVAGDNSVRYDEVEPVFADNTFYLTDPVWSPDGTRIASSGVGDMSGNMVVVVEADGSRMLEVVPWIAGAANLTWSPDGTQLAGTLRTAPQESDRSGIFVVRADGGEKYRWLVDTTPQGPRLGGATRGGLMTWYSNGSAEPRRVVKTFESLRWSPDGEKLAFTSDMDPTGTFYVYTISAEGGQLKRLDATKSAWPNEVMWRPIGHHMK